MKNNINIFLTGMMGSGKTTVGKELKKFLPDFDFTDVDEAIELDTGEKITQIFSKYGESYFRKLEQEKITEILKKTKQIIAGGGGCFENELNRDIILKNSFVIYLKTEPETIYNRIKNEIHRPLLQGNFDVNEIEKIIKKRETNYEKAHYIIDTTAETPYNVVKKILGVLND